MATFRVLSVCCTVFSLISGIPGVAKALSLGELQVLSKPDQAFQAEATIKLGKNEQISAIEVGTAADYALLNLPYTDVVHNLTAKIKEHDGRPFVWLQGTSPIQEQNIYVLLRVSSNRHTYFPFFQIRSPATDDAQNKTRESKIEKIATETGTTTTSRTTESAAEVEQPKVKRQPTTAKAEPPPSKKKPTKPASVAAAEERVAIATEGGGDQKTTSNTQAVAQATPKGKPTETENTPPAANKEHTVKGKMYGPVRKGENLMAITTALKMDRSSNIFQAVVAIWKQNPDQFINNNMNGIQTGAMLVIPTLEEISQIDSQEARQLRLSHAIEWKKIIQGLVPITKNPTISHPDSTAVPPPTQQQATITTQEAAAPKKPVSRTAPTTMKKEAVLEETVTAASPRLSHQFQNKGQPEELTAEESGDLKAILTQLQVITRVLENNKGQQGQLERRVTDLEQSKKEWALLQERISNLEAAKDTSPQPAESFKGLFAIQETSFLVAGIGMIVLGFLSGGLVLWLGRRWNRADHWHNLKALLSTTAQKHPELLEAALRESEPVTKEFIPNPYNQKLEGVSPQSQKRTVTSNPEEIAGRLHTLQEQNNH